MILLVIAATAGFAPVVMFLARPLWFAWVVAVPATVGLGYAVSSRSYTARPLTVKETIGSCFGAMFEPATAGAFLFLVYGAVELTMNLLGYLSWHPRWEHEAARNTVVALGCVVLFGNSGTAAETLSTRLFPKTGIGNPPLFPGVTWRRAVPVAGWTLLSVTIFGLGVFLNFWFAYVLARFLLLIASSPLHDLLEIPEPPPRTRSVLAAVKALLRAGGYSVLDRLQTGEMDLDRLLAVFDTVAHRDGYALAIQLKVGEEGSGPVTWAEATSLRSATAAVYEAAERCGNPVHRVRPMLVLAGREPDRTLRTFAQKESIHIAEMPGWSIIEDIAADRVPNDRLREMAQSHFGLRPPDAANDAIGTPPTREHA